MYKNIGKKIMGLAQALGWCALVAGGLGFLIALCVEEVGIGFLILIGAFVAYVSTWGLCALGQMVDDVNVIKSNMTGTEIAEEIKKEATSDNKYALCNITEADLEKCIKNLNLAEEVKGLFVNYQYYHWGIENIEFDDGFSIKTCGSFFDKGIKKIFFVIAKSDDSDLYKDATIVCFEESQMNL